MKNCLGISWEFILYCFWEFSVWRQKFYKFGHKCPYRFIRIYAVCKENIINAPIMEGKYSRLKLATLSQTAYIIYIPTWLFRILACNRSLVMRCISFKFLPKIWCQLMIEAESWFQNLALCLVGLVHMYQTIGGNFNVIGHIKSLVVSKDSNLSGKRDS